MARTAIPDRDELYALFPDKPASSNEEIHRRMVGLAFTQSADERLHFTMLAPPGWRWRDSSEAGNPPGLLVSLVDGSPARAEISVTADGLRREVSPAEWVRNQLARAGHTPLSERESYGPIGALADLLTQKQGEDGRRIARTNMAKDAGRIFTITCQAREDVYRERADDFFVALTSWKLLHAERMPLAEPLESFCYIYPAVFGFRYPASWTLVKEVVEREACDVRLDNLDGERCAGRIYVCCRPRQSPRRLVSDYLAKMKDSGAHIAELPDLAPCDPPEGFLRASSLVASGTFGGAEMEIRAIVLEIEGAVLLLALRGPARAMSPDWWAINKRAFEIAHDTIYAA